MTSARIMMHLGANCVDEGKTLAEAAQMMREQGVGSLPICGQDKRLHGIVTDRDIVTKCIAMGQDPTVVTAGELANDHLIWVDADASSEEVAKLMRDNKIRRVPVIHNHQLIGMISEADLAQHLDDSALASFVQDVCAAPPNN